MHVIVYGAGAVGSVLGGLLSVRKHDVHLICREPHAQAIARDGLRVRSATGDYLAHPEATTDIAPEHIRDDTVVLLTMKLHDVEAAVETLASFAASTPVFAFQNGVGTEDELAERLDRVYGGVCRMTCSMVQPGSASFRRMGRIILGRHPKGADAPAKDLGAAFEEAGFDVCLSRNIKADKWLKLVVNTQSVFNAVVDRRDHDANEFFELKARIIEETRKVLRAARLRPKSYDGRDPSIDEMLADLRRPQVRRPDHGMNVHNSAWQDLYKRRDTIESPRFHEPIIALAREHGIAVPCNEVALEVVTRCHESGSGPGTVRLREILAAIDERQSD